MEHTTTPVRARTLVTALASMSIITAAATPAAADTIVLEWDPNRELTVIGYMLHVGTQPATYTEHIDVGFSTDYVWTAAVAGQRYCFAVSAYIAGYIEGPKSSEVCGYSNNVPVLVNPGDRASVRGQPADLQLQGSDPDGTPVTYSATGLPPGLALMASTGYISGTPTTAGTYTVVARVSDGVLNASQTFTWTISGQTAADTTAPTVRITVPTTSDTYITSTPTLEIGGTAEDDMGVVQLTWTNDRGESGTIAATSNWTATVPLEMGWNDIIITAQDAAGNVATEALSVRRRRH